MNIINLSPDAIIIIAEASSRADAEGRRFRLAFSPAKRAFEHGEYREEPASVKFKVGEGSWSIPFFDTPDPYRD